LRRKSLTLQGGRIDVRIEKAYLRKLNWRRNMRLPRYQEQKGRTSIGGPRRTSNLVLKGRRTVKISKLYNKGDIRE